MGKGMGRRVGRRVGKWMGKRMQACSCSCVHSPYENESEKVNSHGRGERVGVCSMMSPRTKFAYTEKGKPGSTPHPATRPGFSRPGEISSVADALSFWLCLRERIDFYKWKENMARSGV